MPVSIMLKKILINPKECNQLILKTLYKKIMIINNKIRFLRFPNLLYKKIMIKIILKTLYNNIWIQQKTISLNNRYNPISFKINRNFNISHQ